MAKPLVVIAAGSDSDMPHLETLKKEVSKFKIDAEIRICSAHKQPSRLQTVITEVYNKCGRPVMMVGCAGGTDALSGTASYLSTFPVVSCPPDKDLNRTCLTNPPGSSNAFIMKPANIGKFAAQLFCRHSKDISDALDANIAEKITKLEAADTKLGNNGGAARAPGGTGFTALAGKPLVVIAAGSDSDMPHLEKLKSEIGKFKIDAEIRICSAHKQPARLEKVIDEYSKGARPVMLVGCAGGTDALSGTASYSSKFIVVSCPPDGMNDTCLTNPPGSSNAFIVKPANVAKFAAQVFAQQDKDVAAALDASIQEKITKLEQADEQVTKKQRTA